MSKTLKNCHYKNTERPITDRVDLKKTMNAKVFEASDINAFLLARDRGDSKLSIVKTFPKSSENTINPKRFQKSKAEFLTTTTSLAVGQNKTNNKDCGDIRKEQSSKVLIKVVKRKKIEEFKGKAFVPGKELKTLADKVDHASDAEKFLKVTNQNNVNKKVEDKIKTNIPGKEKVSDKNENQNKTYLVLERRQRIREKYSFKNLHKKCDVNKEGQGNYRNDEIKNHPDDNSINNAKSSKSKTTKPAPSETIKADQLGTTKSLKKTKESSSVHRKPIVKTIKINNDNRVYKDVTFVDQKESTPLKIKIPINCKRDKQASTKTISKIKVVTSKTSVQKNRAKNRAVKKRVFSPDMAKSNNAPPTEVAKWAPSCISGHTKPYYEAWVDTTLAAISKCTKNDSMYLENQNIIKTFKRVLDQRPSTPDLFYEDFKDERYTGRITVRQNVK